jgi:hypothetical protein
MPKNVHIAYSLLSVRKTPIKQRTPTGNKNDTLKIKAIAKAQPPINANIGAITYLDLITSII